MKKAAKGASWSVVSSCIDDDIASVLIKQTGGLEHHEGEKMYYLKKLDGNWKLHVDKENPRKDMISKKRMSELCNALEQFVRNSDANALKGVATDEFVQKVSSGDFKEAMSKAKFTFVSSEIDEYDFNEGKIEVKIVFGDGKKTGKEKMPVKRVNGIWLMGE